ALFVASTAAGAAPWQWRDAHGRMVYSDRPPPSDVRAAQIVRSPAPKAASTPSSAAAAEAPNDASASPSSPTVTPTSAPTAPTWVEREREYRARQAQRAEEEEKARDECESVAAAPRTYDARTRSSRNLQRGSMI